MTSAIRSVIANASPGPRVWTVGSPSGQRGDEEVADLLREVEPDGTTRGDCEEGTGTGASAARQDGRAVASPPRRPVRRQAGTVQASRGRRGQPRFAQSVGVGHAVLRRVTPGLVRAGRRFAGRPQASGGAGASTVVAAAARRRRRRVPGRDCGGRRGGRGRPASASIDLHGFLDVRRRLTELADALAEGRTRRPAACGAEIRSAMTRMMTSSRGPGVGMFVSALVAVSRGG